MGTFGVEVVSLIVVVVIALLLMPFRKTRLVSGWVVLFVGMTVICREVADRFIDVNRLWFFWIMALSVSALFASLILATVLYIQRLVLPRARNQVSGPPAGPFVDAG